jgi:putative ABC transport system permease protein
MGARTRGLVYMWRFVARRRTRSALIILAVAWGTLSMMLLLAFGEGLKLQMWKGSQGLGTSPIMLWAGSTTRAWEGMKPGREVRFVEEDLTALARGVPEIDEIAAEDGRWAVDLRWGTRSVSTHLTGVMPCYEAVRAHHPQPGGRFLNDVDQAGARRVIFLGPSLKERLFGPAEAVGQTVFVRGVPFTVIGVMVNKQQMGMYGGPDVEAASIPLATYESIFGKEPYGNLLYTLQPGADPKAVEQAARQVLARRYHFDPADESAVHIWDSAQGNIEGEKIFKGIQLFLGVVGAMTLLVAGVGLANMLFVMIHRRTREIGLQMAIGAQRASVTTQIVGESLLLAALGGYLGIGLAWLLVEALQRVPVKSEALQFLGKPTLSLPVGIVTVVVLIGIGCLSGTLPARRAARLNPVEALRHE